jgi:hypothetical protein
VSFSAIKPHTRGRESFFLTHAPQLDTFSSCHAAYVMPLVATSITLDITPINTTPDPLICPQ